MAHKTYTFNFFKIINEELEAELNRVEATVLNTTALVSLAQFQRDNRTSQGVYVIHEREMPVYVGKAENVFERLEQHYAKLTGRHSINLTEIRYQAILLEKSMSTAANEDLLIAQFKAKGLAPWNGTGFGPKDPGKERDTTEPGQFDRDHPIKADWPVNLDGIEKVVGTVLRATKNHVPYVFRYKLDAAASLMPLAVAGTMPAEEILRAVVNALGIGWRGAILSYGMVLYRNLKEYEYGIEIDPLI